MEYSSPMPFLTGALEIAREFSGGYLKHQSRERRRPPGGITARDGDRRRSAHTRARETSISAGTQGKPVHE